MPDDDRRGRACDAGKIMMFREPETMIAPGLGMLREIDRVVKRQRRVAAFDDRREVENRKARHGEM